MAVATGTMTNSLKTWPGSCNDNLHKLTLSWITRRWSPEAQRYSNYPMVYATGHEDAFNDLEARNMRAYLRAAVSSSWTMIMAWPFVRPTMKRCFLNLILGAAFRTSDLSSEPQFHQRRSKIHEHDGKPAQGFDYCTRADWRVSTTLKTDLGDGLGWYTTILRTCAQRLGLFWGQILFSTYSGSNQI